MNSGRELPAGFVDRFRSDYWSLVGYIRAPFLTGLACGCIAAYAQISSWYRHPQWGVSFSPPVMAYCFSYGSLLAILTCVPLLLLSGGVFLKELLPVGSRNPDWADSIRFGLWWVFGRFLLFPRNAAIYFSLLGLSVVWVLPILVVLAAWKIPLLPSPLVNRPWYYNPTQLTLGLLLGYTLLWIMVLPFVAVVLRVLRDRSPVPSAPLADQTAASVLADLKHRLFVRIVASSVSIALVALLLIASLVVTVSNALGVFGGLVFVKVSSFLYLATLLTWLWVYVSGIYAAFRQQRGKSVDCAIPRGTVPTATLLVLVASLLLRSSWAYECLPPEVLDMRWVFLFLYLIPAYAVILGTRTHRPVFSGTGAALAGLAYYLPAFLDVLCLSPFIVNVVFDLAGCFAVGALSAVISRRLSAR